MFYIDIRIVTYYDIRIERGTYENGEIVKVLKKNNCTLVRHGSNHDIWYSPITGRQFAVPRHKDEIKTGTAKSILREAGIE
jgi:predicted RNA binding protein YcfA (HicA-like mRNA interferase family)